MKGKRTYTFPVGNKPGKVAKPGRIPVKPPSTRKITARVVIREDPRERFDGAGRPQTYTFAVPPALRPKVPGVYTDPWPPDLHGTAWHFEGWEKQKRQRKRVEVARFTCDYGCKTGLFARFPERDEYHAYDCPYWHREGAHETPF